MEIRKDLRIKKASQATTVDVIVVFVNGPEIFRHLPTSADLKTVKGNANGLEGAEE